MFPITVGNLTVKQLRSLIETARIGVNTKILSALTGKPEQYFMELPIKKLELLITRLGFLLSDYQDFLDGKNKPFKKNRWLFINGKLYIAAKNADGLNTNQYTALRSYSAEKELQKIMAIIYKQFRIKHVIKTAMGEKTFWFSAKFNTNLLNEIQADMEHTKVKKLYGMLFFYSDEWTKKNENFRKSLIESQMNLTMDLLKMEAPPKVLGIVMDGITSLTKLPMERPTRV